MKNHIANTSANAIEIKCPKFGQSQAEYEINGIIEKIFGKEDGNYLVLASEIREDLKRDTYKIVLVEDKDKDKHQLYFKLISPKKNKPSYFGLE